MLTQICGNYYTICVTELTMLYFLNLYSAEFELCLSKPEGGKMMNEIKIKCSQHGKKKERKKKRLASSC